MASIFDSIKKNTVTRTAASKLPTVELAPIEASSAEEAVEPARAKFDKVIEKKKYVTFGEIKKMLGDNTPYRPSDTGAVLAFVKSCNTPERDYTAIVVNTKGKYSAKVSEQHIAALKSWEYTQIPGTMKPRAKAEII